MSMDRSLQGLYGPRFFRAAISVGPRIATKADKANHPKLWAAYQAAITAELNASIVAKPPVAPAPVLEEMPAFLKRKKGK